MYLGYVRSAMEYNLALQNICSKNIQENLNKIQNEAVRFISGGMRSTSIEACEIDTNIEPLDIRRDSAAIEMVERYRRSEEDHPNRKTVENWKGKSRLKKQSILTVAKTLEEKYHLPEQRKPEKPISKEFPPNFEIKKAKVNTELIRKATKKNSDENELFTLGQQTINTYANDCIHVFTDGSAFKGTVNAGYGVRIEYPNGTGDEISEPCGDLCSNFEAEVIAIQSSLERIKDQFKSKSQDKANVVIFSDSKSALDTIKNQSCKETPVLNLLLTIHEFIENTNNTVTLQWIPSHCCIDGNERADTLAKLGAAKEQPAVSVSQATVKQIIKSNAKMDWHNKWALSKKGRALFNFVAAPNKTDPINSLPRKEQVTIFRLRTTHAPLNAHLNKITKDHLPNCNLCSHNKEDVQHFLLECPALTDLRDRLLPRNPTIQSTLYSDKHQLKNTAKYFRMANGRRAQTQETAGSRK